MDQDKFTKLPKWARDHIEHLERQVDNFKAQIRVRDSIASGEGDLKTNVFIGHGINESDVPLPKNSRIRFHISRDVYEYIDVFLVDGELKIMSCGGPVSVKPVASNVVHIKVND